MRIEMWCSSRLVRWGLRGLRCTTVAAAVWLAVTAGVLAGAAPASAAVASPVLVSDINPGANSSSPGAFAVVNQTLFFSAADGTHGDELWRSDGTAAGTSMVKDINPGSANSVPTDLTNVGGTLFFFADDGLHGVELWRSDGTAAGTTLVKDINPAGSASSHVNGDLVNVNGTLFFNASDGATGFELWKSDGTAAGTTLVKDINPGFASSNPLALTNVGGTLFFSADDGTHGRELWKSNGTSGDTTLVKDINPGAGSSSVSEPTNVNGTLFFSAFDGTANGLWKSDGTTAGTVLVKSPGGVVEHLANVAGTLFFAAVDATHGLELWKSDGTAAGTVMVKDINPGAGDSAPDALTGVNGTLFFQATDGSNGVELWKSDGTDAGTTMVKDINPGSSDSFPTEFTSSGGQLYFTAFEGIHGRELWTTDGTDAGTTLVADINPGANSSNPLPMADVNGTLFFGADDGTHGDELWSLTAGGATAPTVVTGQATNLSAAGATLNGTVNPDGSPVSDCHFEYGTSTNYGASVACAQNPGAGASPVAVSAPLSGLAANTTYDYRLVAAGPGGTSAGGNQTFTTAQSPVRTSLTTSQSYLNPFDGTTTAGGSIAISFGATGEYDRAFLGSPAITSSDRVTFSLYSTPGCSGNPVFTSTDSLTSFGFLGRDWISNSDPVGIVLASGTYYWTAVYSGNGRELGSSSPCGAETLTVYPLSTRQSYTPPFGMLEYGGSLSIPFGATGEYDETIIPSTDTASSDTVTFSLYSTPGCTGRPVFTSTASVKNIGLGVGSISSSDPVGIVLASGTYYWTAVYSGKLPSSASPCGAETLTVMPPLWSLTPSAVVTFRAVTLTLGCTTVPCTLTVKITVPAGLRASAARKHRKTKPPVITLARGTVTIRKHGPHPVRLRLTAAGRRFITAHRGRLTVNVVIAMTSRGHTTAVSQRITIKITKTRKSQPH
jgi:ELWxxDGT repeat protein